MPIYAYKCESCGHTKDVLQKMSDTPLTDCPQCGAAAFKKQLTAAGFQLKGSGWYVTDFRGGPQAAAPAGQGAESGASGEAAPAGKPGDAAAGAPSGSAAAPTSTAAPAAAPAKPTAPAPASSTGSSVKSSS